MPFYVETGQQDEETDSHYAIWETLGRGRTRICGTQGSLDRIIKRQIEGDGGHRLPGVR